MVQINLKVTGFEKGKTVMVYQPNEMWEDDVATTSSRISYEIDGCKCGAIVKCDNVEDAVKEIIPKIILDEFLEYDYKFEDLGLANPEYKTCDDGNGFVEDVVEFLNLRNCDICLVEEDAVVSGLIEKGKELFEIVRVY